MTPPFDFLPEALRFAENSPSPRPRAVLRTILALIAALCALATLGTLDRTAVALGRLIPASTVHHVQASQGGVVRQLMVGEGDRVLKGQLLAALVSEVQAAADDAAKSQLQATSLDLQRIEAQLAGRPWRPGVDVPADIARAILAKHESEIRTFTATLAQERAALRRLERELDAQAALVNELSQLLSRHQSEERAVQHLVSKGYVSRLQALAKERERISAEQQLVAAKYRVDAAREGLAQQRQRIETLQGDYHLRLDQQRIETAARLRELEAQVAATASALASTSLHAPESGVVTDLATLTVGAVLASGERLLSIVPDDEPLIAEVWIDNDDISNVVQGQIVRLKVGALDFRRFGPLAASVIEVAGDASQVPASAANRGEAFVDQSLPLHAFKARIALDADDVRERLEGRKLTSGMRVTAEIVVGRRTVLEYLLSPVVGTLDEAGRES